VLLRVIKVLAWGLGLCLILVVVTTLYIFWIIKHWNLQFQILYSPLLIVDALVHVHVDLFSVRQCWKTTCSLSIMNLSSSHSILTSHES
jgi:predicted tellurium resistance membrane protein TerC